MIVDPRKRIRRREDLQEIPPGPVALMGLALEIRLLHDLAAWDTVGARLAQLVAALQGSDSISRAEVLRLRTWASRWGGLRKELRAFYAAAVVEDDAIAAILFRVLDGGDPLVGPQIGHLRRAWREHTGEPGDGLDLAPIPPPRGRTP